MRRRALLVGLMSASATAACGKSRKAPPALQWFEDVELAYAEAKRWAKPVFLSFGASWDCGTKELEHRTFPDPEVGTLLYDGFVCVRVDCSDDEDPRTARLSRDFDIKGVPTLIATDASRRDLWRVTEYTTPDKLAVVLRAACARHQAMRDIDPALRLGAFWGRPVVLLFAPAYDHSSWFVRRDCLGDRAVANMLRDSFVLVDVPCDEGSNAAWQRFRVRGSPTAIVIDGARRIELARLEERVEPRVFERFLEVGLARHRA